MCAGMRKVSAVFSSKSTECRNLDLSLLLLFFLGAPGPDRVLRFLLDEVVPAPTVADSLELIDSLLVGGDGATTVASVSGRGAG